MPQLTSDEIEHFHKQGYIIRKNIFDEEEIKLLKGSAVKDKALDDNSFGREDGEGGNVRLALWNHPGDNIYGRFARCHRLVDTMEELLNDEVYHYHSKMILKDPFVGGAWAWHQDYGYWYENGLMYPDMASVMLAIDKATPDNGCLQIIPGSHLFGRVDHQLTGEQAGADMERVNEILKGHEVKHVELEPGDAVFFHSNLLHRSDQNKSENSRWCLICCYNSKHNNPYKEHHHPSYTPLAKVDDKSIKECAALETEDNASWLKPEDDHSAIKQSR